jgi:hypothetical protein
MNPEQMTALDSPSNAIPGQSRRFKLRKGHHAVLSSSDATDLVLGQGAFVAHVRNKGAPPS